MYQLIDIVGGIVSSTSSILILIYNLTGTTIHYWVVVDDSPNEMFVGPFEQKSLPMEIRDLYVVLKKRGSCVQYDTEMGHTVVGPHLQKDEPRLYTCCAFNEIPIGRQTADIFANINGTFKELKWILQLVNIYDFNSVCIQG